MAIHSASALAGRALRAAGLVLALAAVPPALAAEEPQDRGGVDAEKLFGAIVKVHARAVSDARSVATLGREREGTGTVIGADGLILTIGYLVIEAEQVDLVDARGRTLPATVVGYDHASGLALVRSIVPLDATPLPLGDSTRLEERDAVLVVNHGGRSEATLAYVVSRRPFTGNWEYLLESAIFTSPPALDWSGAALIGKDGALLGVGSLILRDATDADPHLPGNMFVPVDLLKPILDDMVRLGHRSGPARPWLGVAADEVQGRLLVTRVSPDGPADRAGVRSGDIILSVGAEAVHSQAEFYRKLWSRGSAGTDIALRVLQGSDVREVTVHSMDRLDYFRPRPTY